MPESWASRVRLRPGRTTLYVSFRLTPDEVADFRSEAHRLGKLDREFEVSLVDAAGVVHATCSKLVYVRWKGQPIPG